MTSDPAREKPEIISGTSTLSPSPIPSSPTQISQIPNSTSKPSIWRRAWTLLSWTPPGCRWDPQHPPQFTMTLNVLFAFAGGFTVANLYYNHPILNVLARDFGVECRSIKVYVLYLVAKTSRQFVKRGSKSLLLFLYVYN
jgi:hypothetical protein